MKVLIALLTSVLFLTSCEFQQDPLANAPVEVKSNNPPVSKPEAPKACPKEALQVDAPTYVNGRVGEEVKVLVSGRTMIDGLEYEIKVDNMKEFPGAKFDSAKGQFTWVPSKESVIGVPSAVFFLNVSMVTKSTPACQVIISESRSVPILIENEYVAPVIKSITSQRTYVAGDKYSSVSFEMEDIDAIDSSDVKLSFRDCESNSRYSSLGHLVKLKTIVQDENAGQNFSGTLQLDLSKFEYLHSGSYCFEMVAESKFGVRSEPYVHEFEIEAKMLSTRITTETLPDIMLGDTSIYPFSVFDPSGAGQLTLTSVRDLNSMFPGSTIVCSPTAQKWQLNCLATIKTSDPKVTAKAYTIQLVVENKSPRTVQKVVTTHSVNVKVVKAVNP